MLSHTVEYALRAMIFLASLDGTAVNCETLSQRTRVPQGYLAKVMRDLVCAKLVRSFRGPHGGFSLAREPSAITLLEVVNAVAPIQRLQTCPLDHPLHAALCPLHRRIDETLAHVEETLTATTLGDVLGGCSGSGRCSVRLPTPLSSLKESPDEAA